MFGSVDVATSEWTEGIFAQLWRKANKDRKNFTWIVLDGPVDCEWVDNLSSVMDDNRMLTLANNERIPMLRPNCTLLFELSELTHASPAIVSRAGVVHVSPSDLGYKPLLASFLAKREERASLAPLFERMLGGFLSVVSEAGCEVTCSQVGLVESLLKAVRALLEIHSPAEHSRALLERLFLFALIWSVGGVLPESERPKADEYLRGPCASLYPSCVAVFSLPPILLPPPFHVLLRSTSLPPACCCALSLLPCRAISLSFACVTVISPSLPRTLSPPSSHVLLCCPSLPLFVRGVPSIPCSTVRAFFPSMSSCAAFLPLPLPLRSGCASLLLTPPSL